MPPGKTVYLPVTPMMMQAPPMAPEKKQFMPATSLLVLGLVRAFFQDVAQVFITCWQALCEMVDEISDRINLAVYHYQSRNS